MKRTYAFFLPESAGVQLHNILQILHRVIHTFYCNVLAWTVEGVAAGAKVRTGQSHKGKSCALCAAADCNCLRIQPGLLDGFLGVIDQEMCIRDRVYCFLCIYIARCEEDSPSSISPPGTG